MIAFWSALAGCRPLDITDCAYFKDCEPSRPRGLVCGLAHQGDQPEEQTGSSCREEGGGEADWLDPAFTEPSTGVISARENDQPCPQGYSQYNGPDHEGSGTTWSYCVASGNEAEVPVRLSDLPRGAVCGLGRHKGAEQPCLYGEPAPNVALDCPDGWDLRWVPDYYSDRVDEHCISTEENGTLYSNLIDFFFYCTLAAEESCIEGDPGCVETALDDGLICGLHARNEPLQDITDELADLGHRLDYLFASCPEHPLRDQKEKLYEAINDNAVPSCMGRDISDADDCPQGMTLACTWDQLSITTGGLGTNILGRSWCWCAATKAAQGVAPPVEREVEE